MVAFDNRGAPRHRSTTGTWRVLVAVSPLLLADLIRMAVERSPSLAVTVVDEQVVAEAAGDFDVVVTTAHTPPARSPKLLIVLPGPEDGGAPAAVIDADGERWVAISSAEGVVDLIEARR